MAEIFKKALVEKRNVLNELRTNNMTLQELRFFSIYLSKINPRDVSTRVVKFPLEDFRRIMNLGKDVNVTYFTSVLYSLLGKVVRIPNSDGKPGFTAIQLFKECKIYQDYEGGPWYLAFDAHDKALPLMFDYKDRYFKYELWNALRLKSVNQLRMYEILKQYETIGRREVSVADLRELLGIDKNEYNRWNNFKVRVLDACQQALKDYTDICYTYEHGKLGKGGKWLTVIFHIYRNDDYVDQLSLEEFISTKDDPVEDKREIEEPEEDISDDPNERVILDIPDFDVEFLSDACEGEFTHAQMRLIVQYLVLIPENKLPMTGIPGSEDISLRRYHFLAQQYAELNAACEAKKNAGDPVKNRFNYFKSMMKTAMVQSIWDLR